MALAIVKSNSSKTNQGPHLVLIYYKLIFIVSDGREIFRRKNCFRRKRNDQTEAAKGSHRLMIQSDSVKTEMRFISSEEDCLQIRRKQIQTKQGKEDNLRQVR